MPTDAQDGVFLDTCRELAGFRRACLNGTLTPEECSDMHDLLVWVEGWLYSINRQQEAWDKRDSMDAIVEAWASDMKPKMKNTFDYGACEV